MMSFREKSDWCSLIALSLYGVFFVNVARALIDPSRPHPPFFWMFVGLTVLMIVIQVVAHVVLAIRYPKDAQAPVDERERWLNLRSTQWAYGVLLSGVLLAMGTLHLGFAAWQFAYVVLFVVWVAELTHYSARLIHHRSQS